MSYAFFSMLLVSNRKDLPQLFTKVYFQQTLISQQQLGVVVEVVSTAYRWAIILDTKAASVHWRH